MSRPNVDWARAIAYLKPKVPDSDPFPVMDLSEADSPVLRDLGNGLLVAYVVDEGSHFSYVQNRHIAARGVSEADLHRVGVRNLAELVEQRLSVRPYGKVFAVLLDGNFEASVLLLDSVWDGAFTKFVAGEYMAALPARDVLAFGDASSRQAIAELQAVVARVQASEADHQLSDSLYRRLGRTWVPYAA